MTAQKATGLVVRGHDWSETSRIVTLFTREHGKLRALAKGGRRLRSNFEVAFDLLSVCEIVFIPKPSSGLDLLTEARIVERFPILRTDLKALYFAYYLAELLSDGTQDLDPHPALFDATLTTMRELSDSSVDRRALLVAFELVWLRELGYTPRLDRCISCDTPIRDARNGSRIAYSPLSGGIVCENCLASIQDTRWVHGDTIGVIATLPDRPVEVADATWREVRQVLSLAVSAVLGRRPRMLGYLENLQIR